MHQVEDLPEIYPAFQGPRLTRQIDGSRNVTAALARDCPGPRRLEPRNGPLRVLAGTLMKAERILSRFDLSAAGA